MGFVARSGGFFGDPASLARGPLRGGLLWMSFGVSEALLLQVKRREDD